MEKFLENLPKIELHAHLNGSLDIATIREVAAKIFESDTLDDFIEMSKNFHKFDGLQEGFEKFKLMHILTSTASGLSWVTRLVLRNFAKDHIYLELRTTPKTNEHMSKREYLECVLKMIKESVESNKQMLIKLLPSIDRSRSVAAAEETLDVVIKLREIYANIITGIDFSGNPSNGIFQDFIPVLTRARENGLKLTLHCAEIDNPNEINEMIKFGMDRCGHGTFLSKAQINQLGKSNTAIECCLTSNVKCKTVSSYDDHHFKYIFDSQQPVVMCTDDCGVFDTNLTKELLLASKHFGLKISDFQRLSLNAAEQAFASKTEREILKIKIVEYFDKQ